jgi:hypothetical protein
MDATLEQRWPKVVARDKDEKLTGGYRTAEKKQG